MKVCVVPRIGSSDGDGDGGIPLPCQVNFLHSPLNILYQVVDGMTTFKAASSYFLMEHEQVKNIFNGISLIPDFLNPAGELVIRIIS